MKAQDWFDFPCPKSEKWFSNLIRNLRGRVCVLTQCHLHNDERSVQASFALQPHQFLTWEPHYFYLEMFRTATKVQAIHKPDCLDLYPGFFDTSSSILPEIFFCGFPTAIIFRWYHGRERWETIWRILLFTLSVFYNLYYWNSTSNSSDTAHARLEKHTALLTGGESHSTTALVFVCSHVLPQNLRLEQKS